MVVVRVDQFERQHAHAEQLGDLLVAAGVAAHAVAGEQRVAAEQGVAGAFEASSRRGVSMAHQAVVDEPAAEVRLLALPLRWRKREMTARLR